MTLTIISQLFIFEKVYGNNLDKIIM